jgi:hypothetical protein
MVFRLDMTHWESIAKTSDQNVSSVLDPFSRTVIQVEGREGARLSRVLSADLEHCEMQIKAGP